MALRLGDPAPDFTADSTAGTTPFHEYIEGSWATDEAAKARFPGGWETLKPYLQIVNQPRSGS